MLVKLCLGGLEEKVVRDRSFFRRPYYCLVHIVLWVAVSDCCKPLYNVLNDIVNEPLCRSNMNSDMCNLYKSDIFNMLSDLNMGSVRLRYIFYLLVRQRVFKTPRFVMLVELPMLE